MGQHLLTGARCRALMLTAAATAAAVVTLAVEEQLLRPSPLFPTVPAGSLIESSTFLAVRDRGGPGP